MKGYLFLAFSRLWLSQKKSLHEKVCVAGQNLTYRTTLVMFNIRLYYSSYSRLTITEDMAKYGPAI